jgi:hypothetical protein
MKKLIINCQTGEETLVDLTAEEVTQNEADVSTSEAQKTADATAKADNDALKDSAKAKLVAGEPLTDEEADTIVL